MVFPMVFQGGQTGFFTAMSSCCVEVFFRDAPVRPVRYFPNSLTGVNKKIHASNPVQPVSITTIVHNKKNSGQVQWPGKTRFPEFFFAGCAFPESQEAPGSFLSRLLMVRSNGFARPQLAWHSQGPGK
jgi:hypothetical protein